MTRRKHLINAALLVLVVVAVLALAGVSLAGEGKGHGKGKGHGHDKSDPRKHHSGSGEHEYGSGGRQYGHHKVLLCHKGHTINVAPPAVKAHLRHHDKLGAC